MDRSSRCRANRRDPLRAALCSTEATIPFALAALLTMSGAAAWAQSGDSAAQPAPEWAGTTSQPDKQIQPKRPGESAADKAPPSGFGFGSYGRVGIGSDLRGGTPEAINVVAHGSRVVQPAYLEIDTYYAVRTDSGVAVRTVATLGFGDSLFHYTGKFEAQPAVRNLYAEAQATDTISLWAGSRMYRGDDIYLLDFWPLDDLNTLGGGVRWANDKLDVALHMGANRLIDPFQYQEDTVPGPGVDEETITFLDRQRMVASLKSSYLLSNPPDGLGMKVKGYFEVQGVPDGTRLLPDNTEETLPSDAGWTLGAQFGAWGYGQGATYTNVFLRYSRGLAAYDELASPTGFGADKKLAGASDFMLGVSSNFEMARAAVQAAAYIRRFEDADVNERDVDDGWEYIIDVRPHYSIFDTVQVALDLSYQVRFPRGLNPNLGYAVDPVVVQIAPMFVYSPFGNGTYERPHFRFLYRAAYLDEGARGLYPLDDPRSQRAWVHFLGVQAEWWFNSTYR